MYKTIGVSGAIASGKSTFVKAFISVLEERKVPYYHFDADKKTHDVIKNEHSYIAKMLGIKKSDFDTPDAERSFIKSIWEKILKSDDINTDYQKFMWFKLKQMLVKEQYEFFTNLQSNSAERGVYIFDAAFLFSDYWDAIADMVIKVVADKEERKVRYIERIKKNTNNKCINNSILSEQFERIEHIGEREKRLDRDRNRKIIFTMNNTNTTGDVPLILEAKAIYSSLFEEKPW